MSDTLVIRGGALGDFLLTLPILRALRRHYPGHRVEVLAAARCAPLAEVLAGITATRRLDDPRLARFFVPNAPLDEDWRAYFAGFQTIISYLYDPDDFFHTQLARCGAATIVRGTFKPHEKGRHATKQLAEPLTTLGLTLETVDQQPTPWPQPASRSEAPLIALHPGSGSPNKNWGSDNWRALLQILHKATGARILLVSGEAEEPFIDEFSEWLTSDGIRFTPARHLPLTELAAELATCGLFLGHDTGPAHLAAALGVSCVLAFGPTDPAVWAPVGSHVTVLRHASRSLAAIGIDEMAAAALATWQNPVSPSPSTP